MIVSQARRFIFFHNPKAAGTSFRQAIAEYHDLDRDFFALVPDPRLGREVDLAHLRGWELPSVEPRVFNRLDEYRKLIFIRNPEARFISSCFEHFRRFRPDRRILDRDPPEQRALIKELLAEGITHERVMSDVRFVHFSPQAWYVFLGTRRIVDCLLPILSDRQDFSAAFAFLGIPPRPVPELRRGAQATYAQVMCAEFGDFVRRFYARDFQLLQSFHHLRPLLEPR